MIASGWIWVVETLTFVVLLMAMSLAGRGRICDPRNRGTTVGHPIDTAARLKKPDVPKPDCAGRRPSHEIGIRISILVVDNDDIVRTMLCRYLTRAPDCEIVGEACDGVEAVEQARYHMPDVVVMDYQMPRLNGLKFADRITEELPAVRVLMYTSTTAGAGADVLTKASYPVFEKHQYRELLDTIRNLAGNR